MSLCICIQINWRKSVMQKMAKNPNPRSVFNFSLNMVSRTTMPNDFFDPTFFPFNNWATLLKNSSFILLAIFLFLDIFCSSRSFFHILSSFNFSFLKPSRLGSAHHNCVCSYFGKITLDSCIFYCVRPCQALSMVDTHLYEF